MSGAQCVVRLGGGGEEALARSSEGRAVLQQLRDHAARAFALVEHKARRGRQRRVERGAFRQRARRAKERQQRVEEQLLGGQHRARRGGARVSAVA